MSLDRLSFVENRGAKRRGVPTQVKALTSLAGGFPCPMCGERTAVIDSRDKDGTIRRRRACPSNHRVTTVEQIIVGDDGRYQGLALQLLKLRALGAEWLRMVDAVLVDNAP